MAVLLLLSKLQLRQVWEVMSHAAPEEKYSLVRPHVYGVYRAQGPRQGDSGLYGQLRLGLGVGALLPASRVTTSEPVLTATALSSTIPLI